MAIKRYVLVEGNTIGNAVAWVGLADDDWLAANPTAIQVGANKDVAPGFVWNGATNFSRPVNAMGVPLEVSRKGFRRALADNGYEFDEVKTIIRALANPRKRWLLTYLEESAYYRRTDPEMVDMMTNALPFTLSQLNLIFIAAAAAN